MNSEVDSCQSREALQVKSPELSSDSESDISDIIIDLDLVVDFSEPEQHNAMTEQNNQTSFAAMAFRTSTFNGLHPESAAQ